MPPLRPAPVELYGCNLRECSRWAAQARLVCGASKRCPVILAVEGLCPPCMIGVGAHWASWRAGLRLTPIRRSRTTGQLVYWHMRTVRALVGPLWLAMSRDIPLPVDTPLPIILDWLEEAEWIDCEERRLVEDLAGLLPFDVTYQRAMLGHLSPTWPGQAPRPLAIQQAGRVLVGEGWEQ